MPQQDIVIEFRPYTILDYKEYVNAHHNKGSNAIIAVTNVTAITRSDFTSLCDTYRALSDAQDAYILGVFDYKGSLIGQCEIVTLSDDMKRAQLTMFFYDAQILKNTLQRCLKHAIAVALSFHFEQLVVYCDQSDKATIASWIQAGFKDEGDQLVQECDQTCWRTRRVLSYTKL